MRLKIRGETFKIDHGGLGARERVYSTYFIARNIDQFDNEEDSSHPVCVFPGSRDRLFVQQQRSPMGCNTEMNIEVRLEASASKEKLEALGGEYEE